MAAHCAGCTAPQACAGLRLGSPPPRAPPAPRRDLVTTCVVGLYSSSHAYAYGLPWDPLPQLRRCVIHNIERGWFEARARPALRQQSVRS